MEASGDRGIEPPRTNRNDEGESMLEKLIEPEIRELIEQGDFATLADCLNGWLPADLAALVADLKPREQVLVLKSMKPALAASTFEYLDLPIQERLVESLPVADAATLLNGMAPDDRTALLEEVPAGLFGRLLDLLDPERGAVARDLLR
jgi:magnesium transporter